MKKLRLLAAVVAVLALVGCAPIRGVKTALGMLDTSHHLLGYVCKTAEKVHDSAGLYWGVRFVVAALGASCDDGAREVNVSAVLEDEVAQAMALEIGQSVEIDGDLMHREMTPERESLLAAAPSATALNEPLQANSIRPGKRRQ